MIRCATILMLALTAGGAAASSSMAADAAKGARLAEQWCAHCHVIGGPPTGTVQQGPPSFRAVAQTLPDEPLRAFLTRPHGAMPDLALTRAEIDDLMAYINTFR